MRGRSTVSAVRIAPSPEKRPFDIDAVMAIVRDTVHNFKKAALFELAEDGYASPFEQLVACILSIRTRDETTLPAARTLFNVARTPETLAKLSPERIDELICTCSFHESKARQIHAIARRIVSEFGGELPCSYDILLGFQGVGPKCASLSLGIACGKEHIAVDIHVHRITNRWGYVEAKTPEKTMAALEQKLSRRYWVELNRLLVPFGKNVCTGERPRCSTCPVLEFCRQVGVTEHR